VAYFSPRSHRVLLSRGCVCYADTNIGAVKTMLRNLVAIAIALIALVTAHITAYAEMGRCRPDGEGYMICGSGDGAARVIAKTISPSKRMAFAWRLTNRLPTDRPENDDPNLENLIVRLEDGAILSKSHGTYWDLGQKIAKQYMFAVWSPDSRLLVKVAQSAEFTSAELFSFANDDAAIGPFELVKIIDTAVQVKLGVAGSNYEGFVFSSKPEMTMDNQGLIHTTISAANGGVYDLTVQATRIADSFNARVVSISEHAGVSISIIVH
jgi:hypothetical protein